MVQKLFYSILSKCFQIIPLSSALFIGRRLGDIAYSFLRIRRKVVIKNLTMVFSPDKSNKEIKQIAKRTYQNFGMTLIEFIRLPTLTPEYIKKYIRFEGKAHLDAVLQQNRGVVVITGHFDNWELMGAAHTLSNYKVTVYARPLSNTVIDELINGYRTKVGMQVISKPLAARDILTALKANHIMASLIDQDARQHGIFINFFNKPASTFRGPAAFAVRTGVPVMPILISRENKGYHVIHCEPSMIPNPDVNEEDEVLRLTQDATKVLETYIRRYPDQYFWFHKRWKTQPNLSNK
jgi:Kdo2-lipid IVA lauroyltransferase/acyltransferase